MDVSVLYYRQKERREKNVNHSNYILSIRHKRIWYRFRKQKL